MESRTAGDKGRGFFATKEYSAGTEIIRCSPVVYCLNDDQKLDRCSYCLRGKTINSEKDISLKRCAGCHFVFYCTPNCQANHWREFHKFECKAISAIKQKFPNAEITRSILLLARTLWKRKAELGDWIICDSNISDPNTIVCVDSMVDHYEELPHKDKMSSLHAAALSLSLCAKSTVCPIFPNQKYKDDVDTTCIEESSEEETPLIFSSREVYEAAKLLMKLSCNGFQISDTDMNIVAVGIYPTVFLFNHSCNRNCNAIFTGKEVHIRSSEKITIGQEFTISYIDCLLPLQQRRQELQSSFSFTCNCNACIAEEKNGRKNWYQPDLDSEELASFEEYLTAFEECLSKPIAKITSTDDMNRIKRVELRNFSLKFMECENILRPISFLKYQAVSLLYDAFIQEGNFMQAKIFAEKRLFISKVVAPMNYPMLAIHYLSLAKLQRLHEELQSSLQNYQQALDIMFVSHGESNLFYSQVKKECLEVEMELHNM